MSSQLKSDLLSERIILVTGASDGIGREAAITYSHCGADVILLGRNSVKLQRVCDEIKHLTGVSPRYFTFDLAQATPAVCQHLAMTLRRYYPRLDGVLHNAGHLGEITPIANLSPAIWQQVMRVNLDAVFFLTQALLPLLLKSASGSLIFTSSGVGRIGRAGWGAYAASKFATEGLMQVLADEYREQNLRVNCINPGGTRTRMRAKAFPHEDTSQLKTPADIMPVYLYLMSDESREHTGISFDAQSFDATAEDKVSPTYQGIKKS